ncbi:Protein SAWADEE HOMEODOMAIN 1 [Hirschfeldia incana]|nr:Protein SAWADEE HOMEODOMAIN 1 [Hirschfeldia incana]
MDAPEDSSHYFTDFTLAEILDMETLFKELGDQSLHKDFCQTVSSSFSCSVNRKGKTSITWKQVQDWFQGSLEKQNQPKTKTMPSSPLMIVDLSNPGSARDAETPAENENVTSGRRQKGKASDVSDLAFEAKSARDDAWYDVASFMTYRHLRTGELEVRVRFSGFDNRHDEWVNVKASVRERSIPVEPSECGRVKVGDLLLCFQDREEEALYCDAHVVNIKRGVHDDRSCNCVFFVRYEFDGTEEPLGLESICRRPEE